MAKSNNSEWGRFQVAQESDTRSIILSNEGGGGSGKTHFALTMPDPIAVFLFDPAGLKGLLNQKQFRKKDIRVINYYEKANLGAMSDKSDRAQASQDALEEFLEDWAVALKQARSLVWDKEDHVWEMLRYANNEDFKAEPKSYYELNMQYRGWFTEAEQAGKNLAVIRGMKEKWGKTGVNRNTGNPTYGGLGIDVPRGQKEVRELVQVNLAHRWDDDDRAFVTTIMEKCRLGNAAKLIGTEYKNLDFATLVTMLYPDADLDEWGI